MTDEELLSLDQQGFIPGPGESEAMFVQRVNQVKQAFLKLGEGSIPPHHWTLVNVHLQQLFGFIPACLPAFYSNRALMPWQGAAAWVEHGQVIAIQLKTAFRKGHFLKIYRRDELLAHEAVHAARSCFGNDSFEEFFAYMTSERKWRRVLGPIFQRPWEVWPVLLLSLGSILFPGCLFFLTVWIAMGFVRLCRMHQILRSASKQMQKQGFKENQIRSILLRLSAKEIYQLSRGDPLFSREIPGDLRWRLIQRLTRNSSK